MKIKVAENAGFCFGVRRAAEAVEALAKKKKARVFTLGELIHNRLYLDTLRDMGVGQITLSELPTLLQDPSPLHLVVRTHGITREDEAFITEIAARYPHFSYTDMTCPHVKRIHNIMEAETGKDTVTFLFATPEHAEALGIASHVTGDFVTVTSLSDLENKAIPYFGTEKTVIFASQTTQSREECKKCELFFKKHFTKSKIFDTICNVTEKRQTEAKALASNSDVMIVVGGKNSSNTEKLYRICKENCEATYWIESADEWKAILPTLAARNVCMTAGASTPVGLIKEIVAMEEMNFAEMLEESLKTIRTGEVVNGIVTAINDKEIYLDLGTKVTGTITKDQITDDADARLSELFKIGDEVRAFVIRVDDKAGVATLSKKRVDADRGWTVVCELKESGEIVEAPVTEVVNGGIRLLYSGVKIFVPASLTGTPKDSDLSSLRGTTQRFIVTRLDERRKSAIGNIKTVLDAERKAEREARRAEALSRLEVGACVTGVVKSMTTYGAFVDLGGIDGMIHNTELSWKRIKNPSEVLSIGQEVTVTIKAIDPEIQRISLTYKSEENDPWFLFKQEHKIGENVEGTVVSLFSFGAFVSVTDGLEGLIPVAKIALEKINLPADVLKIGDTVTARIVEFNEEKRRPTLSIKAILLDEKRAADAEAAAARAEEKRLADEEAAREREEMAPYIVASI